MCCFQFTDSALFLSSISSISVYFAIPKKWRQQQDVHRCLCMCLCVCFLTMVMLFVYNLVYSLEAGGWVYSFKDPVKI